jgi:subtilisin family serine protease
MKRQTPWIDLEDARRALAEGDGNGVRIAIIDSGVDMSHPSLAHLVLAHDIQISDNGVQAETKAGNGTDVFGHGTAVASIINKLAPKASLGSFQVLGEQLRSRTILIREGVRQAIDAGYDILNCSFGCGVKEQVLLYKDWIDEAYLKGIHIVAACNNIDFRRPEWPGFFPRVGSMWKSLGGRSKYGAFLVAASLPLASRPYWPGSFPCLELCTRWRPKRYFSIWPKTGVLNSGRPMSLTNLAPLRDKAFQTTFLCP